MCERTLLCGNRAAQIFTLHQRHSRWLGCRNAIRFALIIRAHACERATARHQAFEVINMRRLQNWGPAGLGCDCRFLSNHGIGYGSPLPFAVAGLSARAEIGEKVVYRSRQRAVLQKLSATPKPRTDLVKNESMGETLPHG